MSGSETPLLEVRHIEAGYGASQVLFGVSLSIAPHQVVSLMGRNGMGKSTTIKCITGALPVRKGEIWFEGQNITNLPADEIARRGIALVPEGRMCFPNLTVREHLVAFARPPAKPQKGELLTQAATWDLAKIYDLFPRLKEREHHMGNQLSGGEQQMLAIGRALSTNPKLLILDEATEGLAPVIRKDIWQCLEKIKYSGQAILIIDKYISYINKIKDKEYLLSKGYLKDFERKLAMNINEKLNEKFNEKGFLPPGIHEYSGLSFISEFCKVNDYRKESVKSVIDVLDFAKSRNSRMVFIGGSFVTSKENPSDLDVVIVFRKKEHIPIKSERLLISGRRVDIMFCSEDEPEILKSFIYLLSNDAFDNKKGVVLINLQDRNESWKIIHEPEEDTYEVIKRAYLNRKFVDLNSPPGVLVTIHGILSTGAWNSDLLPIASSQGWIVAPFNYGFTSPSILFDESHRKEVVENFRNWIYEIHSHYGNNAGISIIAHSFGTYILGKYLQGFEEFTPVRFNSVILTGSILNKEFDWDSCFGNKISRLRNEIAPNDEWVKFMPDKPSGWTKMDNIFGKSGTEGFKTEHENVMQKTNSIFNHNNVIKKDVIISQWMPYLNSNRDAYIHEGFKYIIDNTKK